MNYANMNYRSMREDVQDNDVLAMAFVNVQPLSAVYDTETAFTCGTLFPCLNKPFTAGGMRR